MKMLAGATAGSSSSAFLFRGNEDNGESVIPGEQRETRNPGGIITGSHLLPLNASFRWHDGRQRFRGCCSHAECVALWAPRNNRLQSAFYNRQSVILNLESANSFPLAFTDHFADVQ